MSGTDYRLERGLPVSKEAERSILGALLLNNDLYDQAAEYLDADDFSLDAHRRIWKQMKVLRESNRPIDMILLVEELDKRKEIEAIGGVAYLSSLIDGVPERPSIAHYVKIVREKAMLRGIINVAQEAIAEAIDNADDPEEVLRRTEQAILQLADTAVEGRWQTFKDSVRDAGGLDGYVRNILDPVALGGIPTGYSALDSIIGGLRGGDFIVVAARPSQGKTAFALNVAQNIVLAQPDFVIAFFSLEMKKRALESRILASMARVKIRDTQHSFDSRADIERALNRIVDKQLFVDDSSYLTPVRLRSRARQLKRSKGRLDIVFVDYLQLMAGGAKFENRTQEVSAISRSLKALAKDEDVPVVALSQLSRNVEGRSDKTPILADLRESGSIEQDADIVAFIHRAEMYSPDPDLKGLADIIIAKNREGATDRVKMCYIARYTRFENLAIT